MIKKISILLLLTLLIIFLFDFQILLKEENFILEKQINKLNSYMNKLKEVSNINQKLKTFIKNENIVIFNKNSAEEKIVKTFDKYQNIFNFVINNYSVDSNAISMDIKMNKILNSRYDIEKVNSFFEKNSLENIDIIYKKFDYKKGEVESDFNLVIPYKGKNIENLSK